VHVGQPKLSGLEGLLEIIGLQVMVESVRACTHSQSWRERIPVCRISLCKMKTTQADKPTIWMDCCPILTNWCPHLWHPHHFYAGCPSWHNPPNLSWLGTGTKYAGLHTRWLGVTIKWRHKQRKEEGFAFGNFHVLLCLETVWGRDVAVECQ